MEPVATVALGFALGQRYTWPTLATLLPICGGVVMASSGGSASFSGVALAMASNLAFCCRAFCLQRLAKRPGTDLIVFFHVSCVSCSLMPPLQLLIEAAEAPRILPRGVSHGLLARSLTSLQRFY